MKLTAVVVLLAVASVALAADVDEVSEDAFTSEEAVKTVHSVNVEMNPQSAIPATIVEHLPSHNDEASEENAIEGNAFETSNFEADVVEAKDSLVDSDGFVDAETTEEAEEEAVEVPRFSSQPIRQLKAMLEMRATPVPLPSMNAVPPKTDKVGSANQKLDIDSLAERAPPGQKPLLDPEEQRASHLYLGYEDPNHLPVGGLKIPVDYSGTIGTEAGNQFNYDKALANDKLRAAGKRVKYKRCANGCTVRTPVMVGYRGVKEWPARESRRVRTPGDKSRIRQIHTDLKTSKRTSWKQAHLNAGRRKLRRSSRTINNLRRKRKEFENTPLKIPVSKW
jgi:hypothetical protein